MKVIILAAGVGSRLGNSIPKPLTPLSDGTCIIERQVGNLSRYVDIDDVTVVVGYKKELIMEKLPDLNYVYNDIFYRTNAAKSLHKALRKVKGEDVMWLNGDVVFEHEIIREILDFKGSCASVNTREVGEEEVKYDLDEEGCIRNISKLVENPLGEVLGINYVTADHIELLKSSLEKTADKDHAVRGLEIAITRGMKLHPLVIDHYRCMEIDFKSDLEFVNTLFFKPAEKIYEYD